MYRPPTGEWYVLKSSTGGAQFMHVQWGLPGDVPVPLDHDGDGLTDFAVYRPSNGVWYIWESRYNFAASTSVQWGLPGDVPVPGDYDGDGASDVTVFRPSTGEWHVYASATGTKSIPPMGHSGRQTCAERFRRGRQNRFCRVAPFHDDVACTSGARWDGVDRCSMGITGDAPVPPR